MNARVQTEELRFKESRKMARNLIMNSPMMKSKPESVLHQARILALQRSKTSGGIAKPRISKLVKQSVTPIVKIKKEPRS
ncbi:hypothetical protein GUITHDRAFT_100045 [Guillardia theta CCMP2712]|uniref:Uncharacterized protein n=1 Tax=Guillardia theta (strain CCMP2712) TaxID=905079 RepID=L1K141_GUITC|nr:hypothetical protein GUITHDRAFT_100045 [Guillardia theta CCMP2712]EKX54571.1 hypothetical protein GUITHDRAFT_100045 [Guillardia theta CCMP2712]|mmetsp:Transcript_36159/g.112950  ORF Transcript_36159/g.112950 Transcript_36159/m.112950 type:complete len:80 (-) Transcript_36159:50-289(-)|eukprot:XP_005841551.1 hypothetical protein GUITHDRAFT_100045 [Guillardia theta CCMP2712]